MFSLFLYLTLYCVTLFGGFQSDGAQEVLPDVYCPVNIRVDHNKVQERIHKPARSKRHLNVFWDFDYANQSFISCDTRLADFRLSPIMGDVVLIEGLGLRKVINTRVSEPHPSMLDTKYSGRRLACIKNTYSDHFFRAIACSPKRSLNRSDGQIGPKLGATYVFSDPYCVSAGEPRDKCDSSGKNRDSDGDEIFFSELIRAILHRGVLTSNRDSIFYSGLFLMLLWGSYSTVLLFRARRHGVRFAAGVSLCLAMAYTITQQ